MIIKIDKHFTHRYALSLIHVIIIIIYMYKQLTSILRMQYSKAENKIYAAMLGRKLLYIATSSGRSSTIIIIRLLCKL